MAHEAGHLMGLPDLSNGPSNNIMFNKNWQRDPGAKPTRSRIDSIEHQADQWAGSLANEKSKCCQ
ncbi:MAG: hypothetical protein ABUL62_02695 [Myxococcales bacterium]